MDAKCGWVYKSNTKKTTKPTFLGFDNFQDKISFMASSIIKTLNDMSHVIINYEYLSPLSVLFMPKQLIMKIIYTFIHIYTNINTKMFLISQSNRLFIWSEQYSNSKCIQFNIKVRGIIPTFMQFASALSYITAALIMFICIILELIQMYLHFSKRTHWAGCAPSYVIA